jgi:antitoxin (DNA-binding transcriptional repressor) of toxin-antitoxin stability system
MSEFQYSVQLEAYDASYIIESGGVLGVRHFMLNVTIDEIQRDPLKYLRQVEAGITFVITQADKPIAELRPIPMSNKQLRPFGLCAGEFTVPDNFDEPLPEDILSAFEGK